MLALLSLMMAAATASLSATAIDSKAAEVIERTRESAATTTVFWRVTGQSPSNEPEYAWAATFQSGAFRRVENNLGRAVADCAKGTGLQFIPSGGLGEYSSSKVVERLCGIRSEFQIRSAEWLGEKTRPFGTVDEVRVSTSDGVTTYEVTKAGEIVRITYVAAGTNYTTVSEPMSVQRSLPAGNIFSKASLATSKVPRRVQNQGSRKE